MTATSSPEMKKEPLNLTLVLNGEKIIVKTGLDLVTYKTYTLSQLDKLNEGLMELKKKHPKENSAILKPSSTFKYEKIVKVIDHTREITKPNVYITAMDNKNKKFATKKLFEKIIFETMD